ncbi:MAG: M1 family metallopeptidase [Lewinellaceae bacterium]|nr:M1 family metallopeptidase [Phaeodactylibacter sp.]MCB9035062.1 M1 family metallopeptidase [Lewinellaceae bacterium]
MMKATSIALLFLIFAACLSPLSAQEKRFFMPREIRQAYENGTRSMDGKPGPKYWHNTVDYTIEVEVIPEEKKIAGTELAVYYNNSPDALDRLVVRLYHDAFRKANPRAYRVRPEDITEGVEITRLAINGQEYSLERGQGVSKNGTNTAIRLKEALPPGAKLTLEIDWAQYIPETTVRTGAYDSTSFFIAYWYPQIAVYDDVFGWDELAYDFSTEFYNNLGNYDVKITAPKNFTVLSTGVLQNAREVLPDEIFQRYQKAKGASETVSIIGPGDLEGGYENQSGAWHYKAEKVSDFAFCLSDHYCWDAAAQEVAGRNVLVNSFYAVENAANCQQVTANQQKTMKHFSEDVPGIPYPYPEFTTFIAEGGGGMEYPMMANNGNPGLGVTVHEMFHTYFPMYVRVNEKRFAWMDEGWADYITDVVTGRYFQGKEGFDFGSSATQVQGTMGTISDLPLITSTQFMDFSNYGYASYPLPAFIYATLHHHLGEETFLKCYREYIRRWAEKSPTPYDFFYTFENVSGQDLAWLWKPWFFSFGTADLSIASFKKGKLTVKKIGVRPVPLTVKVEYEDGTVEKMDAKASVWQKEDSYELAIPNYKSVKAIAVNADLPDEAPLDNYYPALAQRYAQFSIPEGLAGSYLFNEFPVTASVSRKDGLLFMEVAAAGMQFYIIPESDTEFTSLDGAIKLHFLAEDGAIKGMAVKTPDMSLTANKQ